MVWITCPWQADTTHNRSILGREQYFECGSSKFMTGAQNLLFKPLMRFFFFELNTILWAKHKLVSEMFAVLNKIQKQKIACSYVYIDCDMKTCL